MATADESSNYLSGQGVLLLATKDGTTGEPSSGFRAVGNVSALAIGNDVTKFEHKESQSGVRAIDLTLVTQITVTVNMTLESLISENLALCLKGAAADVVAGSVTAEDSVCYHDLWSPMANIDISTVVVNGSGGTPTYTVDTDYEIDGASGAIRCLSAGTIADLAAIEVDYAYGAQETIDALTLSANPVRWGRFHGLNTADNDNPVVVDIYKMEVTPLSELALINDEISQMELETTALSDATRATGSKFFKITHAPTVT